MWKHLRVTNNSTRPLLALPKLQEFHILVFCFKHWCTSVELNMCTALSDCDSFMGRAAVKLKSFQAISFVWACRQMLGRSNPAFTQCCQKPLLPTQPQKSRKRYWCVKIFPCCFSTATLSFTFLGPQWQNTGDGFFKTCNFRHPSHKASFEIQ